MRRLSLTLSALSCFATLACGTPSVKRESHAEPARLRDSASHAILADTTGPFIVPRPIGFVNDFAKILPDSSVRQLETIVHQVQNTTKGEIAVVTVSSLHGQSAFDISLTIARAWRIGYAGAPDDPHTNTGVLVLLAPNERLTWIQLAFGSNAFISNEEAARICASVMTPLFVKREYGAGVVAGVQVLARHFAERFPKG